VPGPALVLLGGAGGGGGGADTSGGGAADEAFSGRVAEEARFETRGIAQTEYGGDCSQALMWARRMRRWAGDRFSVLMAC